MEPELKINTISSATLHLRADADADADADVTPRGIISLSKFLFSLFTVDVGFQSPNVTFFMQTRRSTLTYH